MEKVEYEKYLQSDYWKKIREVMYAMSSENECEFCFQSNKEMDIHHISYERLGFEEYEDLCLVCHDCHEDIHRKKILLIRSMVSNIYKYRKNFFHEYVYSGVTLAEARNRANSYQESIKTDYKSIKEVMDMAFNSNIGHGYTVLS